MDTAVLLEALRLAAKECWEKADSGAYMPFSGTDEDAEKQLVDKWIETAQQCVQRIGLLARISKWFGAIANR